MSDDIPGQVSPSDESTQSLGPQASPPQRIGKYRILQKIGEGGMGEVWEAEQTEPVRRRVALKLIKHGMDTERVIARFEAERQALAMMEHPNVAKVFDAGSTPEGRPYFAMEYVHGVPITEHCDRQRLTTRERLKLFQQVCAGVQHAHQKGIIHRDIKPSNVLVLVQDDERIPKIIDFGVAKATQQRLTERTLFTELGQLIGTPEYMSPEQAEMTAEDVDTRTDVYSLGVLLYELLVGALPFDSKELRRAGFDEFRRRIREEEPTKPSKKVSTLADASTESARNRRTDPSGLARQLRGELDWITMKALEKDRTRRYGSPPELAEDIRRFVEHQPVVAGPPSAAYRARKFLRRHRVGAGVALLLLVVLVAFTLTTTVQSRRIAQEARTSERVSEFLADMLGDAEPEAIGRLLEQDYRERIEAAQRKRGATDEQVEAALASFTDATRGVNATDVGLRLLDEQVMARAAETIKKELADEPLIAARLEYIIGRTYRGLGLYDQAEPHCSRAVEIRESALGNDHPETLHAITSLANLYRSQGRYDEAEPLYVETLETRKRVLGDDHPETLSSMNNLAVLYSNQGRYDEAEALYVATLETRKRTLGDDDPDTLGSMNNLAVLYWNQGRYDEAEPLFVATLETRKRALGDDHPDTLSSMSNLAVLYWKNGRHDEAESLYVASLETRKRLLGDDHPDTLSSMNNLANLYRIQGRYDEAEPLYLETFEARRRVLGDEHRDTLGSMNNLASLYNNQGRYDEAEPLLLKTIEIQESILGDDHPLTATTLYDLACLEALRGDPVKAMDWLRQSVESGFASADHMAKDSDLETLHGPAFDALVAEVKRRVGKE